jgi:hypothetical protein
MPTLPQIMEVPCVLAIAARRRRVRSWVYETWSNLTKARPDLASSPARKSMSRYLVGVASQIYHETTAWMPSLRKILITQSKSPTMITREVLHWVACMGELVSTTLPPQHHIERTTFPCHSRTSPISQHRSPDSTLPSHHIHLTPPTTTPSLPMPRNNQPPPLLHRIKQRSDPLPLNPFPGRDILNRMLAIQIP